MDLDGPGWDGAVAHLAAELERDSTLKSESAKRRLALNCAIDSLRLERLAALEARGELPSDVARSLNSLSRSAMRGLVALGIAAEGAPVVEPAGFEGFEGAPVPEDSPGVLGDVEDLLR